MEMMYEPISMWIWSDWLCSTGWPPVKPRPRTQFMCSLWSKVCERATIAPMYKSSPQITTTSQVHWNADWTPATHQCSSCCFWIYLCIYKITQMCVLEVHKHDSQEVNTLIELCYTGLLDRRGNLLSRLVKLRKSCQKLGVSRCLFSPSKLMNNLSSLSPSINQPASLPHQQPCDKIDKPLHMSSSSALSVGLITRPPSCKRGNHISNGEQRCFFFFYEQMKVKPRLSLHLDRK